MTAPSTEETSGGPGDLLYRLFRPVLPALDDWRGGAMAASLYGFVLQVSRRQQVRLALLTLTLLPLSMLPLELQRRIVNDAVAHAELERLLVYGALYLGVLLLQGGLKFLRDLYLHGLAESVTQMLRRKIVRRETADGIEDGTRQSILAAESEKVGGFVAESIALPLLQAGTVLSITAYMLAMEPLVAVVAIVFLVPSLLAVGFSQPVLNRLSRSKIQVVRALGQAVLAPGGGTPAAAAAPDTLVERIYGLRLRFVALKIATKSFNNLVTGLGLLSILLVGGWMAIEDRTEIGIIVAFMSGYERMTGPVRDLLNFYRRLSTMRVQYRLVADAFTPATGSQGSGA